MKTENGNVCSYKIIAYIGGQRLERGCDFATGCLSRLVWNGNGVKAAAAAIYGVRKSAISDASVEGVCIDPSRPLSEDTPKV